MRYVGEYNYDELAERALRFDATEEDINDLAEWFSRFGYRFWNGECFEIDATHSLYPIYEETAPDEWDIVGYEIR